MEMNEDWRHVIKWRRKKKKKQHKSIIKRTYDLFSRFTKAIIIIITIKLLTFW